MKAAASDSGDGSVATPRPWWRLRAADRRLLSRLAALGALLALYLALDWMPLRLGLRRALVFALDLFGHQSVTLDTGAGPLLLLADGRAFSITANCTYADLVLVLSPLWWRFGRSPIVNLGRLASLALAVQALNLARVTLALLLLLGGTPWLVAHHLPDIGIHVLAIGGAALLALEADRATPRARRSRSRSPVLAAAAPAAHAGADPGREGGSPPAAASCDPKPPR